jgi:hypothetical protein
METERLAHLLLVVAACGAARGPGAAPSSEAGQRAPHACPLVSLGAGASPSIERVWTFAEIEARMGRRYRSYGRSRLDELEPKPSFILIVPTKRADSTIASQAHYLAIGRKRSFLLVGAFFTTTAREPSPCGSEVSNKILGTRELVGADGRRYMQVTVRRRDIDDAPTVAADRATPSGKGAACETLVAFRIEDHVVDVEDGTYVGAVAQTYRAPLYHELDAPTISREKLSVTQRGISVDDPRCLGFASKD